MQIAHRIYIGTMALIVLLAGAALVYTGYSYYSLPIEERFFNPGHEFLKPGGTGGHGFGILGSLSMLFGVFMYMARKRLRSLARLGHLKYWLEFHIFCGVFGPILISLHTSFKFNGLVSVAYWSMVLVVLNLVTFASTRERVQAPPGEKHPLSDDLRDVFTCRPWLVMFVLTLLVAIGMAGESGFVNVIPPLPSKFRYDTRIQFVPAFASMAPTTWQNSPGLSLCPSSTKPCGCNRHPVIVRPVMTGVSVIVNVLLTALLRPDPIPDAVAVNCLSVPTLSTLISLKTARPFASVICVSVPARTPLPLVMATVIGTPLEATERLLVSCT